MTKAHVHLFDASMGGVAWCPKIEGTTITFEDWKLKFKACRISLRAELKSPVGGLMSFSNRKHRATKKSKKE